jgi:DNA-binding Lrp family transcriptional regulator
MNLKRNEVVKDVKEYEGLYAITNTGRVWSHRRKKWKKMWIDAYGYPRVTISVDCKETYFKIHRLVATAFVDNVENKPQVNHKNGVKADCRAANLEWVTARENLQHACDLKLNTVHKTSYREKVMICKLYEPGKVTQREIAELFEISTPAVSYLLKVYMPLTINV